MNTQQLISIVSILFLLTTIDSTIMLLHTEYSNYIYYELKVTFVQRKVMEKNLPWSAL